MTENLQTFLGGSLVLGLLYYVYWQLTVGARRRRIIKENGCLPPMKYPYKDPILGFDEFTRVVKAFKERRGLELILQRFKDKNSNTFQLNSLGQTIITTIEPENIKTFQSLSFKKWSLGSQRIRNFRVFLGPGIFSSDSAEWQHSRSMLRPNFAREQVRDLDTFEAHIDHLIQAIPRDGSTIDLQDLFFRLTMDSATEFLFGESTNTLLPGLSTVSATKFAECFNRAQETLSQQGRYGFFSFLAQNKEYPGDCKFVHGMLLVPFHKPETQSDHHRFR